MSQHLTYKFVPRTETVETALDFVAEEVARLIDECEFASAKFKLGHPKVAAFAKSAADLRALEVVRRLGIDGGPASLLNAPVEFSMQVPRRKAHTKARWSRIGDCSRAVLAILDAVIRTGPPRGTQKAFDDKALDISRLVGELARVEFPKLYD
jgi:hypothetical protein